MEAIVVVAKSSSFLNDIGGDLVTEEVNREHRGTLTVGNRHLNPLIVEVLSFALGRAAMGILKDKATASTCKESPLLDAKCHLVV